MTTAATMILACSLALYFLLYTSLAASLYTFYFIPRLQPHLQPRCHCRFAGILGGKSREQPRAPGTDGEIISVGQVVTEEQMPRSLMDGDADVDMDVDR